mmetsp:Transcript_21969/g.46357  ORF Transcript_21969/g.46357 Transcript_21969/m.46357 type:complete len:604 (+) Transcript_21969:98-1909(+)
MKMTAFRRLFTVATLLKICAVSFYLGYRNAVNERHTNARANSALGADSDCATHTKMSAELRHQIDSRVKEELTRKQSEIYQGTIFPNTMREFAVGALRVKTEDLLKTYDFGVPTKPAETGLESLILYNTQKSLPLRNRLHKAAVNGLNGDIAEATASQAMEQCDTMNVMFTSLSSNRPDVSQCHLLIGNFESYHINRWLRVPDFEVTDKKMRQLDHSLPLRHTGRLVLPTKGVDEFDLPVLWDNYKKHRKGFLYKHLDTLRTFLENVDRILKELRFLLERRNVVRDNTVVVMTVNSGQSELFSNFICAARSRGFDTGNVLVFPTDEESHKLAQGMGVASYYDKKNLGALPKGEAMYYGDPIFASMMFAKVLCVLYVSLLGHDVLFQDVDIVWFKDPLTYFHDKSNTAIKDFDIMFQHDGSSQPRYNPLSANSGFYYVRANKKTAYLFTSLLYHGAVVRKSKSHQQVLVQLLNEHSSMFGLKVKVFDKSQTDMFPGGWHFHQDWETMRKIADGKSNAYIFHMSWTENKANKLLFLRQMAEWYVRDTCVDGTVIENYEKVTDGSLIEKCCSTEPIFSCHFRDKPSKVPCPDSPLIDPHKQRLFWK